MTPHASDLSLERLLKDEPMPQVQDHIHGCDACWQRWQHLHADEGLTLPERDGMVDPPAPANQTNWVPWAVAGTASLVAMAATTLLLMGPAAQSIEVERLRGEVESLQIQFEEAEPQAVQSATRDTKKMPTRQLPDDRARRDVYDAPNQDDGRTRHDIPPEVLEAAVQREIEDRALNKLDKAKDKEHERFFTQIGNAVDTLVADGILTDATAAKVEILLQKEHDETWEIKEAVVAGHLSEEDAYEDWKTLVAEVDEALTAFMSADDLADLRDSMNGK